VRRFLTYIGTKGLVEKRCTTLLSQYLYESLDADCHTAFGLEEIETTTPLSEGLLAGWVAERLFSAWTTQRPEQEEYFSLS